MHNKLRYRQDIDGLRAVAVLAVVLYHAFPEFINGGFIGVDIFFVISGFLISAIILQELNTSCFSIVDFYRRRILRIFPALLFVLILCLLFGWFFLSPDEYKQLSKHAFGGATFTSNFMYWSESGYFDNASITKPLLHLWSLAIEEQFYLVWPFLIWLAHKRKTVALAILGIWLLSFIFNIFLSSSNPVLDFYSPFTRFWELLTGSALAWVWQGKDNTFVWRSQKAAFMSLLGMAFLGGGFYLISSSSSFPGWWSLIPVFGTFLLIGAGPEGFVNKNILSNKLLVWVGLISYPLYLVHWPILSFAHILLNGVPPISVRIICVATAFIMAGLIFQYIEKPIRKIANISFILIIGMVLVGIFGFMGNRNEGFKSRFEVQLPQISSGESDCYSQPITSPCVLGNLDSDKSIVIYGDSHAGQLVNALNITFGSRYKLIFFGNNCFVGSIGSAKPKIWGLSESECKLKREQMKQLAGDNIYAVIRSQRWTIYDPSSPARVQDLMSEAMTAGGLSPKKLIVVGAAPNIGTFKCEIASIYSRARSSLCDHRQDDMSLDKYFISEVNKLNKPNNVYFVHPYEFLCDDGHCQVVGSNGSNFYDDDHFTTLGALKIMPAIANILNEK